MPDLEPPSWAVVCTPARDDRTIARKGLRRAECHGAVIRKLIRALVLATCAAVTAPAAAALLHVGPDRAIKTLAEASRLARDGDTVEVDAGDYVGDVAVWTRDDLTLRAVGGRVRLLANGRAVAGKGIWVVRARNMRVEGFDFQGARVPDRNGAGIRLDGGSLHVRDCSFTDNEMGLLTNNDPTTVLEIEDSEFARNGRPDGHNHQLYVGAIARLSVTGSYFHHGLTGHLLKSRAAVNDVLYNRLDDGTQGRASYELEFPNGGIAHVVGNIIRQSAQTQNRHLIAFGAEGYRSTFNELHLVHNTLIDGRPAGGVFLRVAAGARVKAHDNLLVGRGAWPGAAADLRNNPRIEPAVFTAATFDDHRWRIDAPALGPVVDAGAAPGPGPRLTHEYVHPRGTRPLTGPPTRPGALQSTPAVTR